MTVARDFLDLAWELAGRPGEAAQRSAVSRAYYAAFHHLRAMTGLNSEGKRGAREHQRVAEAATALNPAAGHLLTELRIRRNEADYDIGEPLDPATARISCRIAERLLAVA